MVVFPLFALRARNVDAFLGNVTLWVIVAVVGMVSSFEKR